MSQENLADPDPCALTSDDLACLASTAAPSEASESEAPAAAAAAIAGEQCTLRPLHACISSNGIPLSMATMHRGCCHQRNRPVMPRPAHPTPAERAAALAEAALVAKAHRSACLALADLGTAVTALVQGEARARDGSCCKACRPATASQPPPSQTFCA